MPFNTSWADLLTAIDFRLPLCKSSNIIRIIQIYLDYFQIYLDSLNNILIILFKFRLSHRIYYAQ